MNCYNCYNMNCYILLQLTGMKLNPLWMANLYSSVTSQESPPVHQWKYNLSFWIATKCTP